MLSSIIDIFPYNGENQKTPAGKNFWKKINLYSFKIF